MRWNQHHGKYGDEEGENCEYGWETAAGIWRTRLRRWRLQWLITIHGAISVWRKLNQMSGVLVVSASRIESNCFANGRNNRSGRVWEVAWAAIAERVRSLSRRKHREEKFRKWHSRFEVWRFRRIPRALKKPGIESSTSSDQHVDHCQQSWTFTT